MELRHLRYFVAVALEENITRAAEKLHVSQPALSRQIRDLEDELGFSLLERSAKSVTLTEAGRVFLDEASEVLERLEKGVRAAEEVAKEGSGEIRVGYAPSLTVRILPPAIRAYQSRFPGVKVKLRDMSSEEMINGLEEGKLDLAFLPQDKTTRGARLSFEILKSESLRVAVGLNFKPGKGNRISLEEVSRERLIGYTSDEYPEYGSMVRSLFESGGLRKEFDEEHEGVNSLVTSIEAGIGVAIVSESFACVAGGRVQLLEIDPDPSPIVVGVGWTKKRLSLREQAFVDIARECCEME